MIFCGCNWCCCDLNVIRLTDGAEAGATAETCVLVMGGSCGGCGGCFGEGGLVTLKVFYF